MKWIIGIVCLASCLTAGVQNQIQYQQMVTNEYIENASEGTQTAVARFTKTITKTSTFSPTPGTFTKTTTPTVTVTPTP